MLDADTLIIWPAMLILARVSAFVLSAPLLSTGHVPRMVKAGLIVVISMFLAKTVAWPAVPANAHWLTMSLSLVGEILYGLSLGLAAQMVFLAVQQGGVILAQQMGLTDAEVIDPSTNQESESVATFMEMTFALLFLASGGHHLLLAALAKSYSVFPALATPKIPVLASAIVSAGSTMMLFALKLAALALAAFMVLSIVLAVLARSLPDLNILFESFPLRIGLGIIMAVAMVPTLDRFNQDFAVWMQRLFGTA